MVRAWPIAARQNLEHMWSGRKAWIGQASCLYAHNAPRLATCEAWGTLTLDEQRAANQTAGRIQTERERSNVGQTLFDV